MSLGRIEDYDKNLPIVEIYTAVQSEGSRAGYPTVVIRTTGCTHRCYFGEGGWCDSWYTSIHPEKGKFCFQDIIDFYDKHPHISEMMLTGGSPTMHGKLVNELTHFAHERGIFITIENEGSHFLPTDYPIDLLSISPKFSNSIPHIGIETPEGKIVDEKMIKQHNKFRLNVDAIKNDEDMLNKTNQIVEKLKSFAKSDINENVLMTVLKTQSLVEEIYNGDND